MWMPQSREATTKLLSGELLEITQWILSMSLCPDVFVDLVRQCRQLVAELGLAISFVYRESNSAAYDLAKEGITRATELVWIVDV
ncbi:hypothetical protein V6N13_080141 [Hibiscus sabdariffa]